MTALRPATNIMSVSTILPEPNFPDDPASTIDIRSGDVVSLATIEHLDNTIASEDTGLLARACSVALGFKVHHRLFPDLWVDEQKDAMNMLHSMFKQFREEVRVFQDQVLAPQSRTDDSLIVISSHFNNLNSSTGRRNAVEWQKNHNTSLVMKLKEIRGSGEACANNILRVPGTAVLPLSPVPELGSRCYDYNVDIFSLDDAAILHLVMFYNTSFGITKDDDVELRRNKLREWLCTVV